MTPNYNLSELSMSSAHYRSKVADFLAANGLEPSALPPYMAALTDDDCRIVACAGLDGRVIKCVAVSDALRGENAAGSLIGHVLSHALSEGRDNVFVFTKPEHRTVFTSLGFSPVAEAPGAILLENDPMALRRYTDYLKSLATPGRNAAIVMHANPPTRGHLHLISEALKEHDRVYVILLADNPSTRFPYAEREAMLRAAVEDPERVTIIPGGDYNISAATFPDYFIKSVGGRTEAYAGIDADIFARVTAPALGVSCRYVGTEPSDKLTALYNEVLMRSLPASGIELRVCPRIEASDSPISASSLRALIGKGMGAGAFLMAPRRAWPELMASIVCRALRSELTLTPKPGLVDLDNSGSHTDMDYDLMAVSINALHAPLARLYRAAMRGASASELQQAGVEAEQAMLRATGGVNTHRGAIFALGLTGAAAIRLIAEGAPLTADSLSNRISELASALVLPDRATHGSDASRRYGVPGAAQAAICGYADVFGRFLPSLRRLRTLYPDEALHRLLLEIISTTSDTNLYHRGGVEGADFARREAEAVAAAYSHDAMRSLDRSFIARSLSPGGSADLLSLTVMLETFVN